MLLCLGRSNPQSYCDNTNCDNTNCDDTNCDDTNVHANQTCSYKTNILVLDVSLTVITAFNYCMDFEGSVTCEMFE